MNTRIVEPTPEIITLLAKHLHEGGLVAVPAETVYGLAAHGLDADACGRIFAAKQRPADDPLILHVATTPQARSLTRWNDAAEILAERFWPGPLTLVLPKDHAVPDIATSGLPSVAVRSPQHPVFRSLLETSGLPLAAPSANPFGYISPTTAAHVLQGLDGRIPYILDGGPCPIGIESTILDLRDPAAPKLLRPGAITAEDIAEVLGTPPLIGYQSPADRRLAPGLQHKHYSPRTPLVMVASPPAALAKDEAYVHFTPLAALDYPANNCRALSLDGNGEEAAQKLFATLRELDQAKLATIYIENPPPQLKWREAIFDRLSRAAVKSNAR
ncbi:L-threonylcarbamoyladenylate synthase [Actomonas aquatica]|uniref:Threonylcarbamoyl-AMP synthase n=1 Tax=Actomonas aquatica TaxID=2866162 RepID=A0ABZ1C769_9BACT|nr:L-threonylcarbamoyladenylate synthase [Opitutus sp. WL0086]WRQ87172.1 L-threonylcarbamoyladenylate synthase [Opitutus sp. WL0086]